MFACVVAASAAFAEPPIAPARTAAEPITALPATPSLDPRRVALGERLFHDRRLSRDDGHDCSSCHDIKSNGASGNQRDGGAGGRPLPVNTPTVFNVSLNFRFGWEGKYRSLEAETEQSFRNPAIMGLSAEEAVKKLSADPETARQFREAYGRDPDAAALLDAIASYERTLLTPGSRFDRWLAGDPSAITSEELDGYQQFKSLGCITCHQGVNIGGNLFQRHGIFHPLGSADPQLVRVPSLRNVAATAPYFHDGSATTLPEAVKAMGIAQLDRALSNQQVSAIVAFLQTLTGTYRDQAIKPATPIAEGGAIR